MQWVWIRVSEVQLDGDLVGRNFFGEEKLSKRVSPHGDFSFRDFSLFLSF